jgi:hypothetical protein
VCVFRLTSELGEAGKKLEEANNRVKRLEKCLQETARIDRSRPRPPLNPPRTPGTTSPDSSDDEMGQAQAQKNNRIVSEAVASEQPSVRASPGGSVPPAASQDRPAIDMSQPPPSTRFWSEQSTDAKEQEVKKDEGKTLAKSQSFVSTGGGEFRALQLCAVSPHHCASPLLQASGRVDDTSRRAEHRTNGATPEGDGASTRASARVSPLVASVAGRSTGCFTLSTYF